MDVTVLASLLAALGAAAAAVVGRVLAGRFDTLQSKEREEFEVRFKADQPDHTQIALSELLNRWNVEAEDELRPATENEQDLDRVKFRDLELRLAELESSREASQRDFAIQREYHALGLAQSKLSFNLGYVFGALGGIVILAGAIKVLFFSDGDSRTAIAAFTAVAGAIPEALAALLFVNASRAGTRMTENFDRSRQDRDLAAAQEIAAGMDNRQLGNRLQAVLALSMARSDVSPAALRLVELEDPPRETDETSPKADLDPNG